MGGDVRTSEGVPKLSAFANGSGTPIVIDVETALAYFTTKGTVVPLGGGGGGGDYLPITGGTLTGGLSIDPPGGDGYTAYYSQGDLKGYVYANVSGLLLLNEGGSTALTVPVGTVDVKVAGGLEVSNDVNAGGNVSVGGPYLFMNGTGGSEIGGLIAFNTPGFGNSNQLYGKHVGGAWVGFQMDTAQLAGYRWDGAGFTSPQNVSAYSDARLKTDWKAPAVDFVQRLAGLKAGTYLRTDSQIGLRQAGVVAQEVQELLPEAVISMGDNAFGEGDHTLGMNYGGFSAVAVVMLAREVVALRAEVDALRRGCAI